MLTLDQIQQQIAAGKPLHISGRPSGDGNILDMSAYQGIVEYYPEELSLTVKGGTPLKVIADTLSAHQQALPFYIDDLDSTIGAAYAIGSAELRDAVLGVKVIDGQGRLLTFGGQTMKNVAGYDVARLLVGSRGQWAVVCEISFKVLPVAYLSDLPHTPLQRSSDSPLRQRLLGGLKAVFDPKGLFI